MTKKRTCLLLLFCLLCVQIPAHGQQATPTVSPEILDVIKKAEEHTKAGQFAEARAVLEAALRRYPSEEQRELQIALADAHFAWARAAEQSYVFEEAIRHYEAAYDIDKAYRRREAAIDLSNLGSVYDALSQYDKAISYHEQALAITREVQDRAGEGTILNNLGEAYRALSQYDKAIWYYNQAVMIAGEVGNQVGEGATFNNLGTTHYALSQYDKAIEYYERALAIRREVQDRAGEGATLAKSNHRTLAQCHTS